jgi:hypothetical protein
VLNGSVQKIADERVETIGRVAGCDRVVNGYGAFSLQRGGRRSRLGSSASRLDLSLATAIEPQVNFTTYIAGRRLPEAIAFAAVRAADSELVALETAGPSSHRLFFSSSFRKVVCRSMAAKPMLDSLAPHALTFWHSPGGSRQGAEILLSRAVTR